MRSPYSPTWSTKTLYRYLRSALDIATDRTVFVASVLELRLPEGRDVFLDSAARTVDERWRAVRNVVTSEGLFTDVATLAGVDGDSLVSGD